MKRLTLLFTAVGTVLLLASTVHAADIRLSSSCTLADAIIAANRDRSFGGCRAGRGADTIALTRDITLRDELPVITSDITIEGEGYTISGANRYRIFYNDGGALTIQDLTMTRGRAIVNLGELSIVNSAFSHNSAEYGGAIINWGELSIVNSAFSHNSADEAGGAIVNGGDGELSISDSSFSDNSAENSGAIFNVGELSIVNSAFSHNSAEGGGAIGNGEVGELSIVNSSFSGNSAEIGGAIFNVGELSIGSSSFSGSSADIWGGAIYNWEEGELSMVNSIIAGDGEDACYSRGELKQNIRNFIQDGSCSSAFKGDPMLGELVVPKDGSPAYFPLLAGSPAIDAADDGYCPETDQIGTVRPQGGGCDIGAIEYVAN